MEGVKRNASHPLREIPGVGKAVELDLQGLGYIQVADLRGQDPEQMYLRLCEMQGVKVDRCMLYTFRCAVYYASHTKHDSEKLKWWNWMDEAEVSPKKRRTQSTSVPDTSA